MEKNKQGYCGGCDYYFPRDSMMQFTSCKYATFCTEDCYKKKLAEKKPGACSANARSTGLSPPRVFKKITTPVLRVR